MQGDCFVSKARPMSPTPSSAADSGLELEKLRDAVQRAEQAEKVQRALFAISHAADQDIPLPGMLEQVRSIISELMYADNFYVALHNRLSDSIDFLYMVDSVGGVPASGMSIPMAGFENSLTWHLVHHGKPLRGSMAAIARQLPGPVQPRVHFDCPVPDKHGVGHAESEIGSQNCLFHVGNGTTAGLFQG